MTSQPWSDATCPRTTSSSTLSCLFREKSERIGGKTHWVLSTRGETQNGHLNSKQIPDMVKVDVSVQVQMSRSKREL